MMGKKKKTATPVMRLFLCRNGDRAGIGGDARLYLVAAYRKPRMTNWGSFGYYKNDRMVSSWNLGCSNTKDTLKALRMRMPKLGEVIETTWAEKK